jgi:hypothetical protein
LAEGCNDVFVELAELFPKLAGLFWCTGQKTISGLGNTVSTIQSETPPPVLLRSENVSSIAAIVKRGYCRALRGSLLFLLRQGLQPAVLEVSGGL